MCFYHLPAVIFVVFVVVSKLVDIYISALKCQSYTQPVGSCGSMCSTMNSDYFTFGSLVVMPSIYFREHLVVYNSY